MTAKRNLGSNHLGIFVLVVAVLALFLSTFSESAFSHGGMEADQKPKKIVPETIVRRPKSTPALLSNEDFKHVIMDGNKVPEDVLLVFCTLSTVSCRGIRLALLSSKGGQVLLANTGFSGAVGFQGLKAKDKYVVKIESEKYKGDIEAHAGKAWNLKGEKKIQD